MLAAALIGWGVNTQRVATLQARADSQAADIRANQAELASHDKQLAVIESEYQDIARRLDSIDHKLGGTDP